MEQDDSAPEDTPALPWPKHGSSLFTLPGQPWLNTCLRWAQGDHFAYEEGYRLAAISLYERVRSTNSWMDVAIFPLVYLWRHSIEMQVKRILERGPQLNGSPPKVMYTHDLIKLWSEAEKQVAALESEMPLEAITVGSILNELQMLDPEATGWRYPQDRSGSPNLTNPPTYLHFEHVHQTLHGTYEFLSAVNAEIGRRLDYLHQSQTDYDR